MEAPKNAVEEERVKVETSKGEDRWKRWKDLQKYLLRPGPTPQGLGLARGLGLGSLAHFSSHALPFPSPPSFHTPSLSPAFTCVWWSSPCAVGTALAGFGSHVIR